MSRNSQIQIQKAMTGKSFYIISYDISDQKRWREVYNLLKDFGTWVQLSVFECWLTKEEYSRVKGLLKGLIDPRKDRVRFYNLCKNCREKTTAFGWSEMAEEPSDGMVL